MKIVALCPVCRRPISVDDLDKGRDVAFCRHCNREYSYLKMALLSVCAMHLKGPVPKHLSVAQTNDGPHHAVLIRYGKVSTSSRIVSIILYPLFAVGTVVAVLLGLISYYYGTCDVVIVSVAAMALFIASLVANSWRKTYNFMFSKRSLTFWITTPFRRKEKVWPISSDLAIGRSRSDSVVHINGFLRKGILVKAVGFSMDLDSFNYLNAYLELWKPRKVEDLVPIPPKKKSMLKGLLKAAGIAGIVALRIGARFFLGDDGGIDIGDGGFEVGGGNAEGFNIGDMNISDLNVGEMLSSLKFET